jgi:hypothetical protein
MFALKPLSLLLTLFSVYPTFAIRLPFEARHATSPSPSTLNRRADVSGSSTTGDAGVPVANTHNVLYISNITLGGQNVRVLLDTGSSDLWVAEDIPQTKDTGHSLSLSYAVGRASGSINTATLQFDDYTVNDLPYLLVKDTSTFSGDIHAQGYDGLIGLGPNTGSVIRKNLRKVDKSIKSDAVLDRIFQQNKTSQNFISLLLDRQGDPTDAFKGQFTISELVPGFENVTTMPKLSVELVEGLVDENQHWQILTDKNVGIIGPDGKPITQKTIVPKAPSGRLVAVIDSGFTFPQVPRSVSDAIYGRVQGAVYDSVNEYWTLPCDQMLSLTFTFSGKQYPIHPLDIVNNDFQLTNANGNPICIGAFQPITSAFSLLGNYDMILGMGFLRNTYTLLDYGNFISASSNDRGDPYAQLLPLTDPKTAYNDFVKVRMGGVDRTSDPRYQLLPVDQMQKSPVSSEEKKKKYQEMILSRWPYIFVGCFVFVLLVTGYIIWRCCCRKRCGKGKKGGKKGQMEGERRMSILPGPGPAWKSLDSVHHGAAEIPMQPQGQYYHGN